MLKRKVSAYFAKRKYVLLVVFTALCAGMVVGAYSGSKGETDVVFNQMMQKDLIISSFLENVKFLGWLVLWGANLFGFPVIVYLLYTKGATLSAALCALMSGEHSEIMVLLSVIPYIACTITSVMILSQGALHCSFCLFKNLWIKRGGRGISEEVLLMIVEFIPAILLALLGGVCETIFKVNIA